MKKILILVVVFTFALLFAGSVMAVPSGKTVEWKGVSMPNVTFDGKIHLVNKCSDCHPKIFKKKKGATKITVPHKPGEFCGTCHNGKKAFAQKGNCSKCHKKK